MSNDRNETINKIKRIFDEYHVKRLNIEDEFFLKIINAVEEDDIKKASHHQTPVKERTLSKDPKMEIMVNIDGIMNSLKGTTKKNKMTVGIDHGKNLSVFLTQLKLLSKGTNYSKFDCIVFYDDTAFKTGNKGFIITRDEIISNVDGKVRYFPFNEMDEYPIIVQGPNKDAFRVYMNDYSYDIQFKKNLPNHKVAHEVMKLLYDFSVLNKKD